MTLRILFTIVILIFTSVITNACELKFNISGEKKEGYKTGEELIVEVTVVYTHRTCEIQLADTKFTFEGIKILGATPWKEKTPATFVRQIKIQMLDDTLNEGMLAIVRKCSKEGVLGSVKFHKLK